MKRSIFMAALIVLGLLSSCNQDIKGDKNLKMYETTWNDIVNKGEIDLINENNFSKDITMIMDPENIVGIDAFKDYYQNFITGFSDIKFTVVDALADGDKIAKHWRFQGKHTGEFFGIPATGKTVDIEGTTMAMMKDGKIVQEQNFMDNMVIMQQLGLIPSQENLPIIDELYTNFNKGDIPAVIKTLDANIVWNEASSNALADGNPYIGPDAVLNGIFKQIHQNNEFFKLENIQLAPLDDNNVLASLQYHYKRKNSDKESRATVVHLWTIKNGKATAFQQYMGLRK